MFVAAVVVVVDEGRPQHGGSPSLAVSNFDDIWGKEMLSCFLGASP